MWDLSYCIVGHATCANNWSPFSDCIRDGAGRAAGRTDDDERRSQGLPAGQPGGRSEGLFHPGGATLPGGQGGKMIHRQNPISDKPQNGQTS